MPDAFILSACRTPIGRFHGRLSLLEATDLGSIVVRAAVERGRVDSADVEEVILGNVLTAAVGQAPARQAALRGGLPPAVSALTINKVCGSGLQAVMLASQAIRCGDAQVVVAGGMESMSRAGWVMPRGGKTLGDRTLVDSLMRDGLTCAFSGRPMGEIAEKVARDHGISRDQQDSFAVESHRRAIAGIRSDAFSEEIVPATRGGSERTVLAQDEGPRADTSLSQLGELPPAFCEDGSVTAGNASMISDGAAAVVVASESAAARVRTQPLARIVASVTVGGEPEDLFLAPVAAIEGVLAKAGHALQEVDLFEINEAFAAQMLACLQRLEIPPQRVNIHGGAIALGHPIGASGARILVTLLHALRRRKGRFGVAAACLGGGNAVAMLVERIPSLS